MTPKPKISKVNRMFDKMANEIINARREQNQEWIDYGIAKAHQEELEFLEMITRHYEIRNMFLKEDFTKRIAKLRGELK